jgi:hypothetical protein
MLECDRNGNYWPMQPTEVRQCHSAGSLRRKYRYSSRIVQVEFEVDKVTVKYTSIVVSRPVVRQRQRKTQVYNSRYWVAASQSSIFARQQLKTVTEEMYFLWGPCRNVIKNVVRGESISWSNDLVVGQSLSSKNVSTEAEDIVGFRHQATTGEDTAGREDLMCSIVICEV